MLTGLFVLALQAAAPAEAEPPAEPVAQEQPAAEQAEAGPAAPPRKRVCRTVMDTRTGVLGKRRKVCREVDGETGKTD